MRHHFYPDVDDPLIAHTYGGWWARSLRLLRAAWRPATIVQLAWMPPCFVLWAVVDVVTDAKPTGGTFIDLFRPFTVVPPAFLLLALFGLITDLAGIRVLVQHATGGPVSPVAALYEGVARTPALFGWGCVAVLVIAVGTAFCGVPGIYTWLVLSILPVVVLLERGNAFNRCFHLFHGALGEAVGRTATIGALTLGLRVVQVAVAAWLLPGTHLITDGPADPFADVADDVLNAVVSAAGSVLFTPFVLTAYADLRARLEPFSTAAMTGDAPAGTPLPPDHVPPPNVPRPPG
jgi:hypothetical protein